MNEVQHVTEVAKGISDLGLMAVTAAFFLLLSAAMMIAIFRWFKNIINDMIQEQKNGMKDLTEETRKQNDMLQDISEGLRTETQYISLSTTLATSSTHSGAQKSDSGFPWYVNGSKRLFLSS